jgi:hypothetical protein
MFGTVVFVTKGYALAKEDGQPHTILALPSAVLEGEMYEGARIEFRKVPQ